MMPRPSPSDAARSPPIAGLPMRAPGVLMTIVEQVVFVHLDDRMDDLSYARYLRALEASIAHRHPSTRVAAIYHVPTFSSTRALGAREAAQIVARHREALCQTTACFAIVSPSAVARAAAAAVLAIARLPFPSRSLPSVGAALSFAAAHLPDLDTRAAERGIHTELAAYRHEMGA